jgi:hypothetical protein
VERATRIELTVKGLLNSCWKVVAVIGIEGKGPLFHTKMNEITILLPQCLKNTQRLRLKYLIVISLVNDTKFTNLYVKLQITQCHLWH